MIWVRGMAVFISHTSFFFRFYKCVIICKITTPLHGAQSFTVKILTRRDWYRLLWYENSVCCRFCVCWHVSVWGRPQRSNDRLVEPWFSILTVCIIVIHMVKQSFSTHASCSVLLFKNKIWICILFKLFVFKQKQEIMKIGHSMRFVLSVIYASIFRRPFFSVCDCSNTARNYGICNYYKIVLRSCTQNADLWFMKTLNVSRTKSFYDLWLVKSKQNPVISVSMIIFGLIFCYKPLIAQLRLYNESCSKLEEDTISVI